MGQYYNPVILEKNKKTVRAFLYSWDYDNGLKLMEHSWQGNNFVGAFEAFLYKNPQIVVWAGDYADECKGRKSNVNARCHEKFKIKPTEQLTKRQSRYVINHTKKQFVDKVNTLKSAWGWKIHPLPLLTCEGNNRGGGDYRQDDPRNLIGTWARDLISIDGSKPKGYTELIFHLTED